MHTTSATEPSTLFTITDIEDEMDIDDGTTEQHTTYNNTSNKHGVKINREHFYCHRFV